jgi:hypothetical protein
MDLEACEAFRRTWSQQVGGAVRLPICSRRKRSRSNCQCSKTLGISGQMQGYETIMIYMLSGEACTALAALPRSLWSSRRKAAWRVIDSSYRKPQPVIGGRSTHYTGCGCVIVWINCRSIFTTSAVDIKQPEEEKMWTHLYLQWKTSKCHIHKDQA